MRAWPNGNLTGVLGESLDPGRLYPVGHVACLQAAAVLLLPCPKHTAADSCNPVDLVCETAGSLAITYRTVAPVLPASVQA